MQLKHVLSTLKSFKKQVILGPVFKLTEAVFELIVPLVMAKIIDVGVANGDYGYVLRMGGLMLLLGAVGLASSLTCQRFAAIASQGYGTKMRNRLFAKINSFSHAELDRFGTPSLITRLTNDVNQLQLAVAMLIRLVVRAPFLAVGAIFMAMTIDLKMSLIFLISTPVILLALYIIMNKSVPFYRVLQKKLDTLSLMTRENLSGVRVIRAFSKQEEEQKRFRTANDDMVDTAVRVSRITALLNPLTFLIINFSIVAIVWFGAYQVNDGVLLQGQVIALVNYMSQTLLALIVVANLVVIFTKAYASALRVEEVLATEPSVTESVSTAPKPQKNAPKIQLDDVSFSYGGGEAALEHVNLTILSGQTVGIIGGTGSGKSTLVNLLPRFYNVTGGKITIDGINVSDYPLQQLREKFGIVPQKAVLFQGSIRENMLWGCADATDEEIYRALRIAQALDFVNQLPGGLDFQVEQGGKNFSGGQRQRLTIARALVRQPEILILDDSSSALDFATDAALRSALKHETQGMSVIVVSQRASSIKNADQILVLDDGRVCGLGTHDALLKECEIYQEICQSQLG